MVRVLRNWRGTTKIGEPFKSFNVILMDNKDVKIHAFISGNCADDLELHLRVGNVCSITNFDVQTYKTEDKFRCVDNDMHLTFKKDTKIKDIEEKGQTIPLECFDFYDHNELIKIANKNVYLTDVIGIVKNREDVELRDLVNRLGQRNLQSKFAITDGSSNVNVTFWDDLAKKIGHDLMQQIEDPVIIIITSCKVGTWNDQVDISNVAATTYFLNHEHHSVKEIRKMLSNPNFAKKALQAKRKKKAELMTIADIKKLGKESIEAEVITHANIQSVEETNVWYYSICTGCK
ncbi:hypothetical protein POM88_034895 [Heracleum sosnowskyi]|uniref:Replication protein A 70 kDa DNA-binding subunit B/D first OB fold domain-containing protein n=1 Tax=Heracleum sosnowskyi TaxID=360622 RepID=A0AAD8HM16_9APIA|nr:hypothetical protein POM88_034895 [Heracleum sosnowskyi]